MLHAVGKQNKRHSLLEGIYRLNRHADKRCYYLQFTDGDQDRLIWCAKVQNRYEEAGRSRLDTDCVTRLPVLPPPFLQHLLPSREMPSFPSYRDSRAWQAASSLAAPALVLPSKLTSAQKSQVPVYPRKNFWLVVATNEIFFFFFNSILQTLFQCTFDSCFSALASWSGGL